MCGGTRSKSKDCFSPFANANVDLFMRTYIAERRDINIELARRLEQTLARLDFDFALVNGDFHFTSMAS